MNTGGKRRRPHPVDRGLIRLFWRCRPIKVVWGSRFRERCEGGFDMQTSAANAEIKHKNEAHALWEKP
jgi:hypothetical protein